MEESTSAVHLGVPPVGGAVADDESRQAHRTASTRLDLPTVCSIAIVAYLMANVLHEGVGHASVCRVVGCELETLTSAHVEWEPGSASDAAQRLVSASGTLVNLLAALAFAALLQIFRNAGGTARYFLWISTAVNLLAGTGYLLFSGVIGIGDWMAVIDGWEPSWLWRTSLVVSGIVLYLAAIAVLLRLLAPLVGSQPVAVAQAVRLTTASYVLGSVASTLAALLNPMGAVLFVISFAAHAGGTSGLAWMAQLFKTRWFPRTGARAIAIPRQWSWRFAAAVLLVLHIALLGPGIRFDQQ